MIFGPAPFEAVVTFYSEDYVRLHIEECVLAAAAASVFDGADSDSCAAKLLEHSEQRFRLNYIIGEAGTEVTESFRMAKSGTKRGVTVPIRAEEREVMAQRVKAFVARVERVGGSAPRCGG